ncbi:TPA: ATP-binding cassette domain-containing protein [Corynebacterium striatum]|nr:ATP-binding cassette domain-containing protein [Corynebacterium striatum]HCG2978312.1 ATP-binding cassette domain-containing protein [Corynebacterium striatum]HCG2991693.1 ATP-binding cassette domain-containing protein [Corynebacterium striatum]HCG2994355.1 ATP-binding cassette domain-containing protein [Corynebacterium striatum]HCH2242432.1 ATP-binding cassette domain-containing protein [Corynebacterium striatum]
MTSSFVSDLRFILRAAGVRRRELIAAIALSTVTLTAALALTLTSGWLITRAWQMPPVLVLSVAVTSVRALGISRALFRYVDRLYAHHMALRALTRLRSAIFTALVERESPSFSRGRAHVRLVRDADAITDFLVRGLLPSGTAAAMSVLAVITTALLSLHAAAIMLAAFLVTGIAVPGLVARAATRNRAARERARFIERLDLVLEHRVEFTALGRAEELLDHAAAASESDSSARVAADAPLARATSLFTLATGLAAATLAGVEAAPSLRCVSTLLTTPRHTRIPRERTAAVTVSGLRTEFGQATWDFHAPENSRVIVRGPSGVGKTQLLETIAGLRTPRAGTVTVPNSCHYCAEDAWIFATSVRENLRVAAPAASEKLMRRVLAALDFELDLDLVLADGPGSLSAGQRRRLLLARALCSDAQVLLLDEPTEHIADADATSLLRILACGPLPGARAERTVILVTHSPVPGASAALATPSVTVLPRPCAH